MKSILVVGAGFAGAACARAAAEAGYAVHVIDKRSHVGGNAYDFEDENGIRVHRYGPHLFHTNNRRVVEWLERFGTWIPYQHRVRAQLRDGRFVPVPVNLDTVNAVFGQSLRSQSEVETFLKRIAEPIETPRNAAEYLNSRVGRELADLFFRPYTKKMWGFDLEDLDKAVVRRIPLRYDREDRYFPGDEFQLMPLDGYTSLFNEIFSHENIDVRLNTSYLRGMELGYYHCFNAMPIDEYFDFVHGELPYRSIRFNNVTRTDCVSRQWGVTNYTDKGIRTRETWWHVIPEHIRRETGRRTITSEEPCDYKDNNMERYYPVKTADGRFQSLYEQYRKLAYALPRMTFIGRCGTYQYLDMHQVINQSLAMIRSWLQGQHVHAAR